MMITIVLIGDKCRSSDSACAILFLDGLRSSLDMTMDGRWRHPQNSNITPAVHVLPRHNPDHPLAGERQEFRTNAGPILAPTFSDTIKGPRSDRSKGPGSFASCSITRTGPIEAERR